MQQVQARALTLVTLFGSVGSAALVAGCEEKKPAPAPKAASSAPAENKQAEPAAQKVDSLTLPTLPEMPASKDNPQTDEKVALGHKLFFDKRLSGDESLSCYSCHQNEDGNGGKEPTALGAKGVKLTRHSPVIWNVGYLPALYWDGRAATLEAQALGAWGGGNMGQGADNLDKNAKSLLSLPEYAALFQAAFPGETPDKNHVAKALSAYERTLVCGDTAYDKYAAGDKKALTDAQKEGLDLFIGKGMCASCHSPPFFSTAYFGQGTFFNVGVGISGKKEEEVDVGRMKVSEKEEDWAAFKPPTLRNITKSAPYFHDGSEADLKAAVRYMASGGTENKNRSPLLADRKLSDSELDRLVDFLGALSCGGTFEPPKAQ